MNIVDVFVCLFYAPLVAQAVAVLQDLFTQCNLTAEDVEIIQLVGSVTRMPSLCRAIKDFFGGREPGRALNSEECIAKGCALAAAIISPTFKVRDFAVIDAFVFPVNLSWATHAAAVDADAMDSGAADSGAEKKGDGDIFKQYGALPVTYVSSPRCRRRPSHACSYKLSFTRSQPFDVSAAYGPGDFPEAAAGVARFMLMPAPAAPLPAAASRSIGKFHISGELGPLHARGANVLPLTPAAGLPATANGGPVVVKVLVSERLSPSPSSPLPVLALSIYPSRQCCNVMHSRCLESPPPRAQC